MALRASMATTRHKIGPLTLGRTTLEARGKVVPSRAGLTRGSVPRWLTARTRTTRHPRQGTSSDVHGGLDRRGSARLPSVSGHREGTRRCKLRPGDSRGEGFLQWSLAIRSERGGWGKEHYCYWDKESVTMPLTKGIKNEGARSIAVGLVTRITGQL